MNYSWKRFWCPREGRFSLSDGGYLWDPDSDEYHIYNPDVVPFDSIAEIPCLVLLGEPGIGKTSAMKAEKESIDKKIESEGDKTLWLDLRSYGSEDRLIRNLFENETFISWKKGDYQLHLFLDSLDECLLRIDSLAALLIDELKKYPVKRLCLHIACRTAYWKNKLEDEFKEIWDENAVKVYELVPLRRIDVIEAAEANDFDVTEFLSEIGHKNAVAFAIKPVTLNFLINSYSKKGQLPSIEIELYSEGCRCLCEETNEDRPRNARIYSAEQRMAIASRIAAITVFGNRYAIWTGIDLGDVPEEDVKIQRLYGGKKSVDVDRFNVTEGAIRETLDTGLFSSRGPNRMGWAHQTYAEFLAAHYIVGHNMPLAQITSLITHPGDPEGKLIPQLHGTAAWLSTMRYDVFQHIMRVDPRVLLRSDLGNVDDEYKEYIVERLLTLYDEEKLPYPDWQDWDLYKKLAHPGLADQIRQYICNKDKNIESRVVAIRIASACNERIFQDDLVEIALDQSQPMEVREKAADAISIVGEGDAKEKLKPLAIGELEEDSNDLLKGYALMALWPDHMTAEELFTTITPPKRENFLGIYEIFLHRVGDHIQPQDIPTALRWVERKGSLSNPMSPFACLSDDIMLKSLEYIDYPGVLEGFANAVILLLKQNKDIVSHNDAKLRAFLNENDEKRHCILNAIVPRIPDLGENPIYLLFDFDTPMVLSRDVHWMIKCLQESESEQIQHYWAELIEYAFDRHDTDQLNSILIACDENKVLAEQFAWLKKGIKLDSPKAEKMKEHYLKRQENLKKRNNRPLLDPPPAERIATDLDEFESGNYVAWHQLTRDLTLEPHSTRYRNELDPDLTSFPGWKSADITTRERIIEAAKKYLVKQDPDTNKWLGTNSFYHSALAGYKAFRLLLQEASEFISTIPIDLWNRWAPIILAYPSTDMEDNKIQNELVKKAYQYAPDEIIKTLMILIDKETDDHDYIFITRKIEKCWDEVLAKALLSKARDKNLKPRCMGILLKDLLDHNVIEAESFAEALVTLPPSDERERRRTITAASALMGHAEDGGWDVLWPVIEQDTEFGRDVITEIAADSGLGGRRNLRRFTEGQLADLYIWLFRQYPPTEDPIHEGGYIVEVRDTIAELRDSLLRHLNERGTPRAVEAIKRVSHELPEQDWLKWTILESQDLTRRKTWTPAQPEFILQMVQDRQRRLVENGDQLLDVLIESLKSLEEDLQGETPAVIELWNETKDGRKKIYTPKDENRFSDYVKRYLDRNLRQKGIIVNREVEIRRGEGTGRGERTDIKVDAVVKGLNGESHDSITAIIEVKGCWNRELDEAMEAQLVDRYLKDNHCQHGIYLVGWFNCDQWNDSDYRKKKILQEIRIDEARQKFGTQAAKLSNQSTRIRAFVMNTALR